MDSLEVVVCQVVTNGLNCSISYKSETSVALKVLSKILILQLSLSYLDVLIGEVLF